MKLIAVRLPDEVAAVVEREAAKQERSRSAVVVRALKQAFGINVLLRPGPIVEVDLEGSSVRMPGEPSRWDKKIAEEKPKRERKACQHGDDPVTCRMPACRQARG